MQLICMVVSCCAHPRVILQVHVLESFPVPVKRTENTRYGAKGALQSNEWQPVHMTCYLWLLCSSRKLHVQTSVSVGTKTTICWIQTSLSGNLRGTARTCQRWICGRSGRSRRVMRGTFALSYSSLSSPASTDWAPEVRLALMLSPRQHLHLPMGFVACSCTLSHEELCLMGEA